MFVFVIDQFIASHIPAWWFQVARRSSLHKFWIGELSTSAWQNRRLRTVYRIQGCQSWTGSWGLGNPWVQMSPQISAKKKFACSVHLVSSCGPGPHPNALIPKPFLIPSPRVSTWRGLSSIILDTRPLFDIRGSWDRSYTKKPAMFLQHLLSAAVSHFSLPLAPHSGHPSHAESLGPALIRGPGLSTYILHTSPNSMKISILSTPRFLTHCQENVSQGLIVLGLKVSLFVIATCWKGRDGSDNSDQMCYHKRMDL